MKTIEELLTNLARPEVLEFGLVTNRLPSVNIGGKFEPVDDVAPSSERLLQMLVTMGGSRYVESLSDKPVQWTTRVDGVGVIAVAAIMRKDIVQARFTVAKRETVAPRPPAPVLPLSPPVAAPERAPAAASPSRTASTPSAVRVGPQIQPQVIKSVGASPSSTMGRVQPVVHAAATPAAPPAATSAAPATPAALPAATSAAPAARRVPRGVWDDDDEPTLQTVLPPVSGAPGSAESRPKPARHPDEIARTGSDEAAEQRPAHERAAQERAAAERAAQERAAQERTAAERAAQERAHEATRSSMPRRISTPTSVDVIDIRSVPKDRGSDTHSITIDIDLDSDDDVSVTGPRTPPAARAPSAPAPADIPKVSPADVPKVSPADVPKVTAADVPKVSPADVPKVAPAVVEKARPRVDPSASLDFFLAMAVAARASDLHIVAGRPILLRLASELLPRTEPISADHVERITKDIVPSRLRDSLEREGSCDFAIEHPAHGRFRVNVSRQRTGYKLSLRVVSKEMPTLAALGLPDALASVLRHQRGLVLVTGPRGQGKSCTLAALVDHLNRETARHVMTVEEPIEHVHPKKKGLVSQRDAGLHSPTRTRTFETALRDDADTLVIGELRGVECARQALIACEGGRLVLCTMNAPGVAKAIDRFVDLFSASEHAWVRSSLASSLRFVVGQRLVPSTDGTRLHAAVELLPWSVSLYRLVRDGRADGLSELQRRGKSAGVLRLDESLAELVRAQKVTLEAAMPFAESTAELEVLVSRGAGASAPTRKG